MSKTPALTKAEKDRLLAAGGALRASLVRVDQAGLSKRLRAELWAWAADMRMVQGLAANTTIARYLDALRGFLGWAKIEGLDDRRLKLPDFKRWQRWLFVERRLSSEYRITLVTAVRNFYRWRSDQGLGEDLARSMRCPKRETRLPVRYSPEQLQRLFAAVPPETDILVRDRAILALLLATGARREECAHLDLHQLEPGERVLKIRFKGKGAKERELSIEGEAVAALKAWLETRHRLMTHDTTRLWLSLSNASRGAPVSVYAIEWAVRRAAERARLRDWGVHRFRVTFATELYDQGHDIEEIRQIMGHESIETTRRYLAVSNRRGRVRLSGARQGELMGTASTRVPLWLKFKQKQEAGRDA